MDWSPEEAMNAYITTVKLCRNPNNQDTLKSSMIIEPKCMEFISALAAGNRAQLMVEVTSEGITPLTIALAVAAKQTGGRLICIPSRHEDGQKFKTEIASYDLEDVTEFVAGNPCEVLMRYKNVDFVIIDCKVDDYLKLFKTIDVNPCGSVVVVNNLLHRKHGGSYAQVVGGRVGFESVTLPIGEGMELTRVGSISKHESRRYKRFHVTVENSTSVRTSL